MPKASSKRQITLPAAQCEALGINPGDEVETSIDDGCLTIIEKIRGAAKGVLKHVKGERGMTDEESRQSALQRSR